MEGIHNMSSNIGILFLALCTRETWAAICEQMLPGIRYVPTQRVLNDT